MKINHDKQDYFESFETDHEEIDNILESIGQNDLTSVSEIIEFATKSLNVNSFGEPDIEVSKYEFQLLLLGYELGRSTGVTELVKNIKEEMCKNEIKYSDSNLMLILNNLKLGKNE